MRVLAAAAGAAIPVTTITWVIVSSIFVTATSMSASVSTISVGRGHPNTLPVSMFSCEQRAAGDLAVNTWVLTCRGEAVDHSRFELGRHTIPIMPTI